MGLVSQKTVIFLQKSYCLIITNISLCHHYRYFCTPLCHFKKFLSLFLIYFTNLHDQAFCQLVGRAYTVIPPDTSITAPLM